MRSAKVRKGSVVLFCSCVAEAPTGRCYGGNVLFGPSRPTLRPVPPSRESFGSQRERKRVRKQVSLDDARIPLYSPWDYMIRPSSGRKGVFFESVHTADFFRISQILFSWIRLCDVDLRTKGLTRNGDSWFCMQKISTVAAQYRRGKY